MAWKIEYSETSIKQLKKLDRKTALRIADFIDKRIAKLENPRLSGKALSGKELGDYWRYRVGDYRIICEIIDSEIKILILKLGHRKDIY